SAGAWLAARLNCFSELSLAAAVYGTPRAYGDDCARYYATRGSPPLIISAFAYQTRRSASGWLDYGDGWAGADAGTLPHRFLRAAVVSGSIPSWTLAVGWIDSSGGWRRAHSCALSDARSSNGTARGPAS